MNRDELKDKLWHHSELDVVEGYILPIIDDYVASETKVLRDRLVHVAGRLAACEHRQALDILKELGD